MSEFKPGVYKCSCCGHLIFAYKEFKAARGAAFYALSLTDGGEGFEQGKFCDILARNYERKEGLTVRFIVQTKPVEPIVVEQGEL